MDISNALPNRDLSYSGVTASIASGVGLYFYLDSGR